MVWLTSGGSVMSTKEYRIRLTEDEQQQLKGVVSRGLTVANKQTHACILLMSDVSRPEGSNDRCGHIPCAGSGTVNGRTGAQTVCGRGDRVGPEPQEAVASPPW